MRLRDLKRSSNFLDSSASSRKLPSDATSHPRLSCGPPMGGWSSYNLSLQAGFPWFQRSNLALSQWPMVCWRLRPRSPHTPRSLHSRTWQPAAARPAAGVASGFGYRHRTSRCTSDPTHKVFFASGRFEGGPFGPKAEGLVRASRLKAGQMDQEQIGRRLKQL